MYALSGFRTNDHSIRVSENSSYLRPRAHCDLLSLVAIDGFEALGLPRTKTISTISFFADF
jgi:hypothetical protein